MKRIETGAIRRLVLSSEDPAVKALKEQIEMRSQYEKLQLAVKKAKGTARHAAAVRKMQDWKTANPKYPQEKLAILQTRLRNLAERADPSKRAARKEAEKKAADKRKQLFAVQRQLDRLREELHDLNDTNYDYTPDDVDMEPEEYKASIRKRIAALQYKLRSLK